jgi:subtilase family serine protease
MAHAPLTKITGLVKRQGKSFAVLFCACAIACILFPSNTLGGPSGQLDQVIDHPIVRYVPKGLAPAVSGPTGYTPSQLRKAYGLDQITGTGTGIKIAIVDAYGSPTIQSDLNFFDSTFGLPAITLTIAQPGGVPGPNAGWAVETALDVEWAHAIAPGASILLVEAPSTDALDLLSAVDYATAHGAKVVSMSWGSPEAFDTSIYDSHFNHPGVTYLASSGDDGNVPQWPAVSPYVVAVGGTTLTTLQDGTYVSERAWPGSGGGTSAFVLKPTYQIGYQTGNYRGVPDVAFDADPNTGVPVYDTTDLGGWWRIGGTSLSAPCWAAFYALINHSGPAWTYSQAASAPAYSANYHDITTGSNGLPAGPGYDLVTGLGSPKANDLSGATPAIYTLSLPNGEVTVPYSQTLAVSGGTAPYTWSITQVRYPRGFRSPPRQV